MTISAPSLLLVGGAVLLVLAVLTGQRAWQTVAAAILVVAVVLMWT